MLFTVNIATYNQLDNLKLILKALEDQIVQDFEIIVCDDGSSDGTPEYMKRYPNIKYFWQEDRGFRLAKSKNNGIKAAQGEYFVSLEADVIPNYKMLAEYKMWAKPDTVLLGVRHDILELPTEIDYDNLDSSIVDRDWRMAHLGDKFEDILQPWRLCSGCNVLFPTAKLKEIGGWNEDFTHYGVDDWEVCLRMVMEGCKIEPLPAAYGYHLKHDIRQSTDENLNRLEKLEALYESSN